MARLAGVDLPAKKRTEIGLTYIYGIGRTRSKSLCHRAGVDPNKKVSERRKTKSIISARFSRPRALSKAICAKRSQNIKRLIEMGAYRGLRHRRGLPVRGQRTHTNARTRKGPRRGTVANKKEAAAKT
jgi:small subunit ribosomal protein S13